MLTSEALVSVMNMVMMVLMILGTEVEAAPSERGVSKHLLPSLTHTSAVPERASVVHPSQHLKHWLLSTKEAGVDGTTRISDKSTRRAVTAGIRAGANPEPASPDKRAQMLKMISAMEELHKSTLSSRITFIPRANGRNSGRKNKVPPAGEEGVKPTTAAPAAVDSTASRASADIIVPSLTGRNVKKSLSPQTKKTNKRVCFWKYCSQN